MSKKPQNPPAFPHLAEAHTGDPYYAEGGMTLRDYFAGQAIIGIYSHADSISEFRKNGVNAAQAAYSIADSMLTERSKS